MYLHKLCLPAGLSFTLHSVAFWNKSEILLVIMLLLATVFIALLSLYWTANK